jgi:hypothetical protein
LDDCRDDFGQGMAWHGGQVMSTLFWPAFPFVLGAENYSLEIELPRGCTKDELPRLLLVAVLEADLRQIVGPDESRPVRNLRDYIPTEEDIDLFRSKIPSVVSGPIEADWTAVLSFLSVGHGVDVTAGLVAKQYLWVNRLIGPYQPLAKNQRVSSSSIAPVEKTLIDELVPIPPNQRDVTILDLLGILRSTPSLETKAIPSTVARNTFERFKPVYHGGEPTGPMVKMAKRYAAQLGSPDKPNVTAIAREIAASCRSKTDTLRVQFQRLMKHKPPKKHITFETIP